MVKVAFPFVEKNTSKGRVYLRYRRNGRRVSLPSDPTSKEFYEAYHRIHSSFEDSGKPSPAADSVTVIIDAFKKSSDFLDLSRSTQANYKTHLRIIDECLGNEPIQAINRRIVLAFRDMMLTKPTEPVDENGNKPTYPARANYAGEVFRRLLSFAFDRGYILFNPATRPGKVKTGSYRPWTEADIEAFREIAPPHIILALDIALHTGQRLGDILNMTWSQITDDGGVRLTQGKTGAELWLPLHHKLAATLETHKKASTSTHIVTTAAGKPYKPDHFKHEWKRWADKAGLQGLVFHGLRKTATGNLAEAGCTSEQIKAITGHKTDRMVSHYVAGAKQKERAKAAMKKLETAQLIFDELPNS